MNQLTRRGLFRRMTAFVLASRALRAETRFPVRFDDVAAQAGLTAPTVYGGASANRYILETTGCGVAFFDYDNDGWLDIFLVNGATLDGKPGDTPCNRLLHNNRDGTFRDVTRQAGLLRSGWGQGVCIGDYNNDGYDDLFITYWGQNVLYRNNGDGTFTDVTARSGLLMKEPRWGSGCAFLDVDGNGYLDLFVSNYIDFDLKTAPPPGSGSCTYSGLPVNCGPQGLPKAGNILFRNNGDGTFTDTTLESGIGKAPRSYGLGVLVADFDDDGRPDIYVANDSEASYLFWNNGDGTFTEGGLEAGVGTNRDGRNQSGMGVAAADYDCDGRLDILKTNFSDDFPNLYRNLGKRIFEEQTLEAGLVSYSRLLGWGCGFLDCDNNGWPDLFYVNGHVYPEIDRVKGPAHYRQPKVLYQNLGNGKFRDVSSLAGSCITAPTSGRGCAFGDFNNDGLIDIAVNPINAVPQLLQCSSTAANNWITLKLVGTKSNRSAIGARVRCQTGDHIQTDEVRSGGSFYSQNDLRIHFGLGKSTRIDQLEIRWPSGRLDRFHDVPANRILKFVEEQTKLS
ncbi:MAG: CRTAC1 family protein [Acidobacteriaceae bacterium]|nr:CRTAC1 family protein [Acidobacteriaceae bacterium]